MCPAYINIKSKEGPQCSCNHQRGCQPKPTNTLGPTLPHGEKCLPAEGTSLLTPLSAPKQTPEKRQTHALTFSSLFREIGWPITPAPALRSHGSLLFSYRLQGLVFLLSTRRRRLSVQPCLVSAKRASEAYRSSAYGRVECSVRTGFSPVFSWSEPNLSSSVSLLYVFSFVFPLFRLLCAFFSLLTRPRSFQGANAKTNPFVSCCPNRKYTKQAHPPASSLRLSKLFLP